MLHAIAGIFAFAHLIRFVHHQLSPLVQLSWLNEIDRLLTVGMLSFGNMGRIAPLGRKR